MSEYPGNVTSMTFIWLNSLYNPFKLVFLTINTKVSDNSTCDFRKLIISKLIN